MKRLVAELIHPTFSLCIARPAAANPITSTAYTIHYTWKKYLEMQAVTGEGVGQGLAVAYAMATNCDKVGSKQGDLEELMMTVGVNVDNLM